MELREGVDHAGVLDGLNVLFNDICSVNDRWKELLEETNTTSCIVPREIG